jgi:hypothetical protein
MRSPFPGMDPYLEGYLWPDVYQQLAAEIRKQLVSRIQPRYVARLAISMIKDKSPEADIGIMYPDVEVVKARSWSEPNLPLTGDTGSSARVTAPTITEPIIVPALNFEVRLVTVEIRDVVQNQLVTSIEILSPVNKREPGLTHYRQKRDQLVEAGVHLLEVDLLRRGERPPAPYIRLPETAYIVTLTRSQSDTIAIWPIALAQELPVVAVPLRQPDPDVPLALGPALETIYAEARYDLSLDYTQPPPPPPFHPDEIAWLKTQINEWLKRE